MAQDLIGELESIQKAIETSESPLIKDKSIVKMYVRGSNGETLLHEAVRRGWTDAAKTLIEHGADPNKRSGEYKIPLHVAIEAQVPVAMVEMLLEYGGNLKQRCRPTSSYPLARGKSPLRLAVEFNQYEIAKLLLDKGAIEFESKGEHVWMLATARRRGNEELAELLEQTLLSEPKPERRPNLCSRNELKFFIRIMGFKKFYVRKSSVERGKLNASDLEDIISNLEKSDRDNLDDMQELEDVLTRIQNHFSESSNFPKNKESDPKTYLTRLDAKLFVHLFGLESYVPGTKRRGFDKSTPMRVLLLKKIFVKNILDKSLVNSSANQF